MTKRIFDFLFSAVLLILLSPVLLLTAVAIRLSSKGAVIFKQTRAGKDGVPFEIWKFRTMVPDADRNGVVITTAGDPRVTPVGAWLRRTKLDELPQLVNVLRGEMSFVGPRPEVPRYVALYTTAQRAVLSVRPGITGISQLQMRDEEAQLEGVENIEAAYIERLMPAKLKLDLEYVRNSSFGTDLLILMRTAFRLSDVPRERGVHSKPGLYRTLVRHRRVPVVLIQLLLVVACNYGAFLLRFDGVPKDHIAAQFWHALPWLIVIRASTFAYFRLYEGLWRYTGIYDLQMLLGGTFTSSVLFALYAQSPLGVPGYPRSVYVIDFVLCTLALGGLRLTRRITMELWPATGTSNRLLVYGAGGAGEMIVREIRQQPAFGFHPIGFIDDDARKVGTSIHGVRVLGTSKDLARIVKRHRPSAFLIAVPNSAPERVRTIAESLEPFDLPIKILPRLQDVIAKGGTVGQIRTLAVEDLLQRPPIGIDEAPIKRLIRGRRVMVTGAGGSIGSELCRQILKFEPSSILMFERYENSLHQVWIELERSRGSQPTRLLPLIGDVSDRTRVKEVLSLHHPEIIFHAAAHKHVPLMEENPSEAVKNNIRGTRILASAAERWGVDRMIFISTDKAANPTSIMGASKRVAEEVVLAQSEGSGTSYSIVRFGNVLGSNGSVVPLFLDQIARGGPVTVTHPEVRRFFMLIPEAVSLVLHAASQAHNGGTYVLEMGQQIRIVELARNMIRQAGFVPDVDIKIEFTGLRPGEKLAEELVSTAEGLEPSSVANISHVIRSQPSAGLLQRVLELEDLAVEGRTDDVVKQLWALAQAQDPVRASVAVHDTALQQRPPQLGIPCTQCAGGKLTRSRERNSAERMRKRLSDLRLYRCDTCGWRGWLEPREPRRPSELEPAGAPDFSALDQGTAQLTRDAAATPMPVRRRRKSFSPRDL